VELTFSLLGETQVFLNGKPIQDLSAEKARALLYYLAVEGDRAHRRESLAEMLWPEKPPGYGRNNLKQTLSILKKTLGDAGAEEPIIISSKRDLQFNTSCDHQVDALELERISRRIQTHSHQDLHHCEHCSRQLETAAELYQDDFLSDFYLPDSPEFNEWTLTKREYLRRLMVEILTKLSDIQETHGDHKKAATYARKLVELEPWSEVYHRRLIALLAASGKRSAALKQYQACERILRDEFDALPSPQTMALYERIKSGEYPGKTKTELAVSDRWASEHPPHTEGTKTHSLSSWVKASLGASLLVLTALLYTIFSGGSEGTTQTGSDAPGSLPENQISAALPTQKLNQTQSDKRGNSGGSPSLERDPLTLPCLEVERLLYLEDFQDGQAQGWPEIQFQAQNWEIVEDPTAPGNLLAQNPGTTSSQIFYQGEVFSDAVFRVDFMSTGISQLIFIWHSNKNSFLDERGVVTDSDYSIAFMDYGLHFERYTFPLPSATLLGGDYWITPDSWHKIEISTYQGTLGVWMDGEEMLTYQDPNPLPPGTIGIGVEKPLEQGTMTYFDNLRVCELTEPFLSQFTTGQ